MERLARLRSELTDRKLDAALIHRPENIRYLSGYTGEGALFIGSMEQLIITDFRYTEQAGRQAPDWNVVETSPGRREADWVRQLSDGCACRTLGVESDYLSHDSFVTLQKHLPFLELSPLSGVVEKLREIKDDGELDSIAKACEIASRSFENILGRVHPGMTEKQVQILLDYEMLNQGGEGNAFETIAAAGVNGSLPHAVPSDYVIQSGDMLTLDFGTRVNGYCSDLTRTVAFGEVSAKLRDIYDTVLEAHMAALTEVRPGMACAQLDKLARDIIEARYPGSFGHSLGHGVGLYIHEEPRVAAGSKTVLAPGHVITIEPGIYIPGVGGCRIEDTVIVTSDGYSDPVSAPKEWMPLSA